MRSPSLKVGAGRAIGIVRLLIPGGWLARAALGLGALLALTLGVRAWVGRSPQATGATVRVRREDLVQTVEVEGELAAVRAIEIGAPAVKDVWDFKISFLAPESKKVRKGEPVIGFDTQQLQKTLEEKTAELAEATKQIERREIDLAIQIRDQQLRLDEAEAKLAKARLKNDVPEDLKGRIDAQQARLELQDSEMEVVNDRARLVATKGSGDADLRSLRSRRDRAKGRVEELRSVIETLMVKAPQDGIVIYKTGWQAKKKVGDSTWIGEKVLELPDLSEMQGKGQVDEADAGQVAVGQKLTVRLEARPDLDFTGIVRSIGRTVLRKSRRGGAKVYKINVALDKTDPAVMRPAMRFRGEIETARFHSVLVAPREAIFLRASGPIAWVRRGWRYEEVRLELGRTNKRFAEILSGLRDGDELAAVDLREAAPGRSGGPMAAGL